MSRGIYDYYPNKVMKMKIFKGDNYEKIEEYSKKIMEKKLNISDNIDKLIQKIDLLVEEDIFKDKF